MEKSADAKPPAYGASYGSGVANESRRPWPKWHKGFFLGEEQLSDLSHAIDICKRIERTLQNEWGGQGKGMIEKLRNTQFVVPEALHERVLQIGRIRNKIFHEEGFEIRNPAEFVKQGEQLLTELSTARRNANAKAQAQARSSGIFNKVATGIGYIVALLIMSLAVGFFFVSIARQRAAMEDEMDEPVRRSKVVKAKPAPVKASVVEEPDVAEQESPREVPAASARVAQRVDSNATASVQKPMTAKPDNVTKGAAGHVVIEAPDGLRIRANSARVKFGTWGEKEVSINVTVENIGFDTLKRVEMSAWLYDTSRGSNQAVIEPDDNGFNMDRNPWHVFLQKAIKRGESGTVDLYHENMMSKWSSDNAIALLRSGHYQIRFRVVDAADGWGNTVKIAYQ